MAYQDLALIDVWWKISGIPQSFFRRLRLQFDVLIHGGRIELGRGVAFKASTRFQGKGSVFVGDQVSFGFQLAGFHEATILIQPRHRESVIRIGNRTSLMNGGQILARQHVSIGQDCLIGSRLFLIDSDFHGLPPSERRTNGKSAEVIIEDNVLIGAGVTILKGVRIGRDAVVGSGTLVTKNIAAGEIVGGNPMRIIGSVYQGKV